MDIGSFLQQYTQDPEILEELTSNFTRKKYPKGTVLIEPFNNSKKIFFFEEGLSRIFYLKEGKDITHAFFKENQFYNSIESTFLGKHSPYGLELIENSKVATINYEKLEELKEKFPILEKIQNLLMVNALHYFSERLYAVQFQSAQDRYKIMMQNYPDILLRASLGHIASYLGITQQTLSVIRSKV